MANVFLTPARIVERMMCESADIVANMPMDKVRSLAEYKGRIGGVIGALLASGIIAAQERVRVENG